MYYKWVLLILITGLLNLNSCKEKSNPLTLSSNIFWTQENELNHLNLEISAESSDMEHNEELNFTSDSISIILQINYTSGSGAVHLYDANNKIISDISFNTETVITDTLYQVNPGNVTIMFLDFTGWFIYKISGL